MEKAPSEAELLQPIPAGQSLILILKNSTFFSIQEHIQLDELVNHHPSLTDLSLAGPKMDPYLPPTRGTKRQRLEDGNDHDTIYYNVNYLLEPQPQASAASQTSFGATDFQFNFTATTQFGSGTYHNQQLTLTPHIDTQPAPAVGSTVNAEVTTSYYQVPTIGEQHPYGDVASASFTPWLPNVQASPAFPGFLMQQDPIQASHPWLSLPFPTQLATSHLPHYWGDKRWANKAYEDLPPSPTKSDMNVSQKDTLTTHQVNDEVPDIVCFGMVPSIAARCDQRATAEFSTLLFPVQIDSSTLFSSSEPQKVSGQILSEHGQMIQGLLDEKSLDLYTSCAVNDSPITEAQKASRSLSTIPCILDITVYGPLELFDEIGPWFEDYQVYLQDPRECHRDVRHQKQALTFMLRRERGWAFFEQEPDVWEIIDTDHGRFFLNRVSNVSQIEEPPQCYGGIVADPMGLGKTLTMIALTTTDLDSDDTHMDIDEDDCPNVPATLIVVPPPLMGTWEEQLSEHVVEGGLSCHRHHREGRLTSITEIEQANIVLTTYHTISAEWSQSGKAKSSILFSVRWRRVILDEAICALEARCRWAVTGTPLQNRLGDLATLFKFIRAHPYTDRKCFDTDISRLWKTGQYEEAIKRLKRLSKCLVLRRDKGTVSLPPRRDLQCPVNFRADERALYDKIRQKAIISIDEALKRDSDVSKSGAYVNVLQQIESLRLVCNLGLHYNSRHSKGAQESQIDYWMDVAQSTFNMQRDMGPIVCSLCWSTLDITETLLEDSATAAQNPLFFRCLSFVCTDCMQNPKQNVGCGHNPCCTMAHVSTSGNALEASLLDMQPHPTKCLPSKVEALIIDIKTLPLHEKCIVFSTWRLTLDVVEAGLSEASIPSVRFDGKVPQNDRQNIVERFRHDPAIRVMLLTLSCGAAGLTLTEATRAYLMEPHWNPTLEEQALARIHRIGQTREVTTVRFFVRDSFEQQVIKVQESKKHLAGLLLSPHESGQASENMGRLQELLSLIR
ncbi:alpha-1,6-mannosyltransferase subunit [Fusarium austroafricanum]|uniref:Alpha-1,6-mannosyltransferase subunit n=1 Tax=Fusarium austroafricanum TaxID=2364996 RepID=A0A8H4JRY2_9HYPO|nr:alpha-1,6-mannosyltransferase subunit [Fusarium austroafricanum]